MHQFSLEVDDVIRIFTSQKENPPIHANMAPITGIVSWVHELKARIDKSFEKIMTLNEVILSSEDFQHAKTKYETARGQFEALEKAAFVQWSENIIDSSEEQLSKPLLRRDPATKLLHVNFDAKVVALLREVKYFQTLGVEVPAKASNIYKKGGELNKHIFSLEQITVQYNMIMSTVLPVELPLIQSRLNAADKQCQTAIDALNWQSPNVEEYIKETAHIVGFLANILQVARNNVDQIKTILAEWCAGPFIERKDGKKSLNLEEKNAKVFFFFL